MTVPATRAFGYRFHPTDAQAAELSRTFGCVPKVYNLALQARSEALTLRRERVTSNTPSTMSTAWSCDGCGATHDRDINAARNVLAAGLAVSVCGAGVRPQRETSRTRRSATKQKPHGAIRENPLVDEGAEVNGT